MKYFAVIDTNVLVSAALKWQSVPGSIIDLAFNDVIVPHALDISEEHLYIDLPDPKDRVFYEVTMQARKDEDAYFGYRKYQTFSG